MRILYLCADSGIPIRGTKGAAIHVRAMIDAFVGLGHQVTLITPRPGPERGSPLDARIIEASTPLSTNDREEHARHLALAVRQAASDELGRESYGMIYERYSLWSTAGAEVAEKSRLPFALEVNAPLVKEASLYRTLNGSDVAKEIERTTLTAANVVTVVSSPLRDYVIGRGADATRVHILPNGVDEKLFHPAVDGNAVRSNLGLEGKFVLGFVGTPRPWHDLDTLIAAVCQLRARATRDYHLLLIGDFPEATRLRIAETLQGAATIVGPVAHEEVPTYTTAMDIAVSPHPDLKDFYFSPLKLFEYLASGVPTIAANVPPIRAVLVDGETGWLYPPGDASALAARIDALAEDSSVRTRVAWAGAACVLTKHTWKQNAARVIELTTPTLVRERMVNEPPAPLFDDKLGKSLFRMTRADLAVSELSAHLGRDDLKISQIQVLKYKPRRRCVVKYDLATPTQPWSVIGKVFKDHRGLELQAMYCDLWANGFARNAIDGITVPEPLAYIPSMRMLVQEYVPGETLEESIDSSDFMTRISQSAAAIAKLHSSAIHPVKRRTLNDELTQLTRFCADLIIQRPEYANSFSRQLDALCGLASDAALGDPVPSHRDYYYSQILFADRRVTLMDLDLLAYADPALDVGNFIAHLRFLGLQKRFDVRALDDAASHFLEEYLQMARGLRVSAFLSSLAFYENATYFRLLHVALERPHLSSHFDSLFALTNQELGVQGPAVPVYS